MGPKLERTAIDSDVIARFERSRQCETMTLREACVLSEELARRLADVEPRPDIVLGIANGGLLVADIVATSLSLPLESMKIQRQGSGVKKALTRVPGARRLLAWLYDHTILRRPMAWLLLRSEPLRQRSRRRSEPLKPKPRLKSKPHRPRRFCKPAMPT